MIIRELIDILSVVDDALPMIGVGTNFDSAWDASCLSVVPEDIEELTVSDFIESLELAITKDYEGYKGGEFSMDDTVNLYIADYGDYGSIVTGVEIAKFNDVIGIKLKTEYN